MKSKFNRFLGMFLSVVMILTMLPTISFAAEAKSGKFTVDGKEFILMNTEPVTINGVDYYPIISTDYVSYTWRKAHFILYYPTEVDGTATSGDVPVEIHLTNYDTGEGETIQNYGDRFSIFEDYMVPADTEWNLYNNGVTRLHFKGNVVLPTKDDFAVVIAGDKLDLGADDNFLVTSTLAYFGYWVMFGSKADGSESPDNPDINGKNGNVGSSLAGGTWYFKTYITKEFFDENKIDVNDKLGGKVIDFFNDNYTKGDLRRMGYTDAETVAFGHPPATEPATGVELNKNSTVINLFKSEQLSATVLPAFQVANENVIWSSSNPDSVTVDQNGLVKAIAPGSATITVTTEDGGFTDTCDVTVFIVNLNRLTLDKTVAKIYKDDVLKLTPIFNPVDVTYTDVEWSTSDASKATVTEDGVVTALSSGNVTITATYKADPTKTATCSIAIYDYINDFKSMGLSQFIIRYFGMISVDMTLMTKTTADMQNLAKAAINVDNFTPEELGKEINKQLATQIVSATTTADDAKNAVSDYNNYINLEFTGWMDDVVDEDKPNVYKAIADGTFNNAKELVETYQKAVIVAQINDVTFSSEIQGVLSKYDDEVKGFGINLGAFETLIDTGFSDSLLGTYADWSAFETAYNKSVTDYTPQGPIGGGSGGGGGGSGSGGGKGGGTVLVQFTPEVDKELLPDVVPEAPKAIFTDLDEAEWAIEYVEPLAKLGHINGKAENKFCPNDNIKREEVVKILVSALGLDTSSTKASFTDVNAGEWYAPYLAAAKENGIINGNTDGSFGVNDNITREELATMIYRASKLLASETDVQFADEAQIADYAKEAVSTLVAAGVINGKGDNNFAPKANATRAEASKIIYLAIIGK